MASSNVNTAENDQLAKDAGAAIREEIDKRGIVIEELDVVNFSDINIDIVIIYDNHPHLIGYHKAYYSIGRLRAKLEGNNGFEKIELAEFANLIVDHFEFSKEPPKRTPRPL